MPTKHRDSKGLVEGLPAAIYKGVYNTMFFSGPNTPRNHWNCVRAALDLLADADAAYPGNSLIAHMRTGRISDSLELALAHPTVIPKADRVLSPSILAAACIGAMPAKVDFDTQYGSACIGAWVSGHRAFAATSPSFKRGVPAFERAAEAERNAPRTHAEGRLKTKKFQHALVAAGKKAPWYPAVLALLSSLPPILRIP